jgi:S-(hydroxymethyl)glutathione dehydrogenase/alcohol dehydrogenase
VNVMTKLMMKAAILTELNRPLIVSELEIPDLGVGQVLVRVHASGICGAQLGEISGAKGPDKWLPHLLGHEGGGVVLDVGPGVTQVKPGDHVVMHWRKGAGIEAAPPRYQWGDKTVGGGWVTTFNDHAVVSENRLTPIPKDIPFDVAALMGCAVTTALGMISNEAKLKIGESVAVAGAGGVGLNVIQAAFLAGANPILAYDRVKAKAESVFFLGGDFTDDIEALKQAGPFDVFVDTTGDCNMISLGYDLIKPVSGRMILLGQPHHEACLSLPGFRRHYCGKTILDSQGGLTEPNVDIPRYLGLWRAGRLPVEQLITHRFSLEQVNEALDMVRSGLAGRVILEMV